MSTSTVTAARKASFFNGRRLWFLIAVGLGLVTTLLLGLVLASITSTTTYYVVGRDIPARTLITEADLVPVVTSANGQPPTAFGLEDVNGGELYSLIALSGGDILTESNAGSLTPLSDGIPSNYVIASFTASPNLSAGGNVKRGNYVDLYYIADSDGGQSVKLFLQRVLIVDATSDLESAPADNADTDTSSDPNSVTSQYRAGVPVLYTVGVTQEDAAKIALASQFTIYMTLSSADSVDNEDGVQSKSLQLFLTDLFTQDAGNAGLGTDNTFSTKPGASAGSGTVPGTTDQPQETGEDAPVQETPEDANAEVPEDAPVNG